MSLKAKVWLIGGITFLAAAGAGLLIGCAAGWMLVMFQVG